MVVNFCLIMFMGCSTNVMREAATVAHHTWFSLMVEKQKIHNKSKNYWWYVFKYAVTAALNHENIGKHPERISR